MCEAQLPTASQCPGNFIEYLLGVGLEDLSPEDTAAHVAFFPPTVRCCPMDASPRGICCLLSCSLPQEPPDPARASLVALGTVLLGCLSLGLCAVCSANRMGYQGQMPRLSAASSLSLEQRADVPLCPFVPRTQAALFRAPCSGVSGWTA